MSFLMQSWTHRTRLTIMYSRGAKTMFFNRQFTTSVSGDPAVVDSQNELSNKVLAQCDTRDKFAGLMRQLYDYPKYGTPSRHGDRWVSDRILDYAAAVMCTMQG